MTLFHNKYRIESARLKGWDYSNDGLYFVTICTHGRECLFGQIIDGEMKLNAIGEIVKQEWEKTNEIRKSVELNEYIIMPNHFHAIIGIWNENYQRVDNKRRDALQCVSTLESPHNFGKNNLSNIIRGFKSSTTRKINEYRNTPGKPVWQTRFYDHIIRYEKEFNNILIYIVNNPINWIEDDYFELN